METTIQLKENTILLLTPLIREIEKIMEEIEQLKNRDKEISTMIRAIVTTVISQEGISDISNYNITIEDNHIILKEKSIDSHDSDIS